MLFPSILLSSTCYPVVGQKVPPPMWNLLILFKQECQSQRAIRISSLRNGEGLMILTHIYLAFTNLTLIVKQYLPNVVPQTIAVKQMKYNFLLNQMIRLHVMSPKAHFNLTDIMIKKENVFHHTLCCICIVFIGMSHSYVERGSLFISPLL